MYGSKVLHLKYENQRFSYPACAVWHASHATKFDGEPDTGMKCLGKYQGVTVAFKPERIVW